MTEEEALKRALDRERERRRSAELLLEEKSRELFVSFEELDKTHTELKRNQKKLIRSEKMASLGIMSAGVAHEINNPVGFAISNMRLLEQHFPVMNQALIDARELLGGLTNDDEFVKKVEAYDAQLGVNDVEYLLEDIPDLISETSDGLNRIQEIVQSLGTITREDSSELVEVDVNVELQSALALVTGQLPPNTVVTEQYGQLSPVRAKKTEFGRVIMNLLLNAVDAMTRLERDQHELTVGTRVLSDNLCVFIEDSGCGMSIEVQEKVFTPFFTTKDVGQGIGLGLAASFGIMEDHGGTIEFQSSVGGGSRFELWLPNENPET